MKLHFLLTLALLPQFLAAASAPWPAQYKIKPWETAKLTAGDVVGPDGIVYPDFRRCGVEGGIPDFSDPVVKKGWKEFLVSGGANDDQPDDAAVEVAMTAAIEHSKAGGKSIVAFPAGKYLLSRPWLINTHHVVISGAGAEATTLRIVGSSAKSGALFDFIGKDGGGTSRPYRALTKTAARGAMEVFVESSDGIVVGSWIRLTATKADAGSTMRERYSWPESHVIYDEPLTHFGRMMFARVVKAEAGRIMLDRPVSHDLYQDEFPELRSPDLLEGCGLRNLTLITDGPEVSLDPVRFRAVANSWLHGVTIRKPRDWPVLTSGLVNFEYRDCRFDGTWAPIGSGSRAYLGFSGYAVDCLMENCEANDLRHMAIFQGAIRCVVRNSRFTGQSIASPQLHGQFPHDSMVERCEFSTPGHAYTVDGMATLRHGVEGPRFVLYGNRFNGGNGACYLPGGVEGHIIAYNRFEMVDDKQSLPGVWIADRVWDGIFIGNSMRVNRYQPVFSMQDESCGGWEIRDNTICGSNGWLAMGDSVPAVNDNNRFFPHDAALPEPKCESIFDWQKQFADSPRLVMSWLGSAQLRQGQTPTLLRITRIRSDLTNAQKITLKATPDHSVILPPSVTIEAGSGDVDVVLKSAGIDDNASDVVVTAEADSLLADRITARLLSGAGDALEFGRGQPDYIPSGGPVGWKATSFGIMQSPGIVRWGVNAEELEIEGAGDAITFQDSHLGRSGRTQAWRTLEGDGTIIARVDCSESSAQAGLIIADDEGPTTEFILITSRGQVLASGDAGKPPACPVEYRKADNGPAVAWLRLTRRGAVFAAWRARVENPLIEADWERLVEIDLYRNYLDPPDYKASSKLDATMHFGVFLSSGDLRKTATAGFSRVEVRPIAK